MSRNNDTVVADDEFWGVMFLRIILVETIYIKDVVGGSNMYLQAERFVGFILI